jgi:ABC-type nitrate/sulfonate/bicarbonate transport system permease component
MYGLLIAQVEHEPPVDHGVVLLAVVLIAVVGAVVYGLIRLVGKRRTARTRGEE